jgi:3-oxoacyl-[acyl-carrier protein] reductase
MKKMSSTQKLHNKICLVTGGTRGIGFAIAEMLVAEGAQVVVSSRTQASVDQAVLKLNESAPGKVKGKVADVKDYEQVHALFQYVDQECGGLDILVNNAGIGRFAAVSGLNLEDWADTIGTNLNGAFYCAQQALRRFEKRGGGYIVNVSSLAGKNAFAGGAAYNASKFGLNGFSEALMLDARYDNVRVSTILPGSVATDFGGGDLAQDHDWKVMPQDVAEIVRMLLLMPERTMVSHVEVRPSKPKKKS